MKSPNPPPGQNQTLDVAGASHGRPPAKTRMMPDSRFSRPAGAWFRTLALRPTLLVIGIALAATPVESSADTRTLRDGVSATPTTSSEHAGVIPRWLKIAGFTGAALLALLAASTALSRFQVRRKTRELALRNAELSADIAERKRIRATLGESEQRFQALFDQAPGAILLISPEDGAIVEFNRAAHENLGYTREEFSKLRLADIKAIGGDSDVRKRMKLILANNPHVFQTQHQTKTGEVRDVRVSASVLPLHGKPYVQSVYLDVTDTRRAEEALRDSESRFRGLIEAAEDCIFTKDRDLRYTQVNPAMARLFGRPAAELIGLTDDELFGPESAKHIRAVDRRVLAGETVEEEDTKPAAGAPRTFQVIKVPIYDDSGAVTALFGIARDVTERKRTENELRRRNHILGSLSQTARLLIGTEHWETHIKDILAQLGEATGVFRMRLLEIKRDQSGKPFLSERCCWSSACIPSAYSVHRQDKNHPNAREVLKWIRRLGDAGPPNGAPVTSAADHERFVHTAGECSVLFLPVYAGSEPCGVLAFDECLRGQPWSDLEVEALRAAAGLIGAAIQRDRVAGATRELESQLRQAQKMEAVGQLAGGVAHDFNNILTAILGNVELSLDALQADLPANDPLMEGLQQVEHAAHRAASLTRQLLVFSRHDVSESEALSLGQTLTELGKMLRRLVPEMIRIETDFSPDTPLIWANAGQIEQVVMNLVVNAGDAMNDGGVLRVETRPRNVDQNQVAAHPGVQAGRFATLSVSDAGCGMSPEVMERIFEPFYTTKAIGHGSGLGLAMVHGIMKKAGGFATVESEVGRGSKFTLYFPAYSAKCAAARSQPSDEPAPGGDETVLVCEDDAPVRDLAVRLLRDAGYNVIVAYNGVQALELAEEHLANIHLLLTDVVMPDVSGKKLADTLEAARPNLKTLFMSGHTSPVLADQGVMDNVVDLLRKPFSRSTLLRHVRNTLDQTEVACAQQPEPKRR